MLVGLVAPVVWRDDAVVVSSMKLPRAVVVMVAGVVGFVIIDLWIRPRRTEDGMERLRRCMPLWAVLPFIIGLMTSAWTEFGAWRRGLDDVRDLAAEMEKDPDLWPSCVATSQSVERTVHNAIVRHFPGRNAFADKSAQGSQGSGSGGSNQRSGSPGDNVAASPAHEHANAAPDTADGDDRADEERRFIELARVVGHDLLRTNERLRQRRNASRYTDDRYVLGPCAQISLADKIVRGARKDTKFYFVLSFVMQALFVLWIPFLLVVSIARANGRLAGVKRNGRKPDEELRCELDEARDVHILGEDHAFFVPRLCFAALLLLGTTYVFAPFGLKTSYAMSLVEAHALPGHTSFVLWCNHLASAPVITIGFVGFLIYALITATQRFAQDDFDDVAMFSLLIRGLTVILLSLALSSAESSLGDVPPRLVVFLAGVFPVRALAALAKRANMSIDPEFEPDDARSFACIPSLDPTKVFALRAAGIQSTYDLASVPIVEIIGRVRIDPRLLGRAIDRAILVDAVGDKLTEQLDGCAITCASELVDAFFDDNRAARPEPPSCMSEQLIIVARRAAARLSGDPRLAELKACLDPMAKAADRAAKPGGAT